MERMEHKHTKDTDNSLESNDKFDDNACEAFHAMRHKPDKRLRREANGTIIEHGRRQYEQSIKTQDQFVGPETSNKYYSAEKMPKDRDTIVIEEGECSRGEHVYGGAHDNVHETSHKRDRQERSRNYARSQHSLDKFYPADAELSTHTNPTYKYSGQEEPPRVPSRGKTCLSHYLGPSDHTSLPAGGNSPNIQHSVRTGSTTHTSRSPVSLPSPGSSKSNTPRHLETSSTSRSGTNKSSLIPPSLSKTSTPYKVQRTNREPLPAGTTASSSKTCTPKRDPSHNTSMQSEGVVCRICHDGDRTEVLISPCYCAGSMGLLHVSCLQRWLGSSNKTSCEICNFQFALKKKTMPISQFLKEPGTAQDKKNLICDLVSFLLITPLTIVITGICIYGAKHYYADKKMERSGLIGLAVSLLFLYIVWLTVAVRHNWRLWNDWRMFHQEVTLLCTPCDPGKLPTANNPNAPVSESLDSRSTLGSIHLQSIKVSVKGPMTRYKGKKPTNRTTRTQQGEGSERTSDRTSDSSRRIQSQGHSRPPIPSVSQDVHSKMPRQEDYFQQLQGEGQPVRQRVKGRQAIKYATNDNVHYYNTEERRGDKGKRIRKERSPQQACNHSDRRSRYSGKCSSGCSSILTEDNQQHRKCRTDFGTHDQIRERKAYTDAGWQRQRNLTNTPNMSTGHGRNVYKKHDNINTESKSGGGIKADRRQEKSNAELDIFSRGGSPPEEEKSHDNLPYDDFVTKWIHDQTKVLVIENQRSKFRDSTNFRGSPAVAVEEISSKRMHSPCETSHHTNSPNRSPIPGASKENEKNFPTIRMPASLSISSSDTSFEQVIRENNLDNENDNHFNQTGKKVASR